MVSLCCFNWYFFHYNILFHIFKNHFIFLVVNCLFLSFFCFSTGFWLPLIFKYTLHFILGICLSQIFSLSLSVVFVYGAFFVCFIIYYIYFYMVRLSIFFYCPSILSLCIYTGIEEEFTLIFSSFCIVFIFCT